MRDLLRLQFPLPTRGPLPKLAPAKTHHREAYRPEMFSRTSINDWMYGLGYPFRNPRQPLDVNDDGRVDPFDVLILVNAINESGPRSLPWVTEQSPDAYLDVHADGELTPRDILTVINAINALSVLAGEGESAAIGPRRLSFAFGPLPAMNRGSDAQLRKAPVEDPPAAAERWPFEDAAELALDLGEFPFPADTPPVSPAEWDTYFDQLACDLAAEPDP